MNLREKVIEGFVHTYIENEQVIVRNLLQTGRIEEDEWKQISQELTELTEKFNKGEKTPEQFLEERRELRKEFNRSKEEKQAGLTREEAEGLYEDLKEGQRKALGQAFMESGTSTVSIVVKILFERVKFIAARLKNI